MKDFWTVHVKDLRLNVFVGVFEEEHKKAQEIVVSIDMTWDASTVHDSEDLDTVVDYNSLVVQPIMATWPNRPHTKLIETLAEDAVALCFKDPRVTEVSVQIMKPEVYGDMADVGISLHRKRGNVTG